LEGHVLSFLSKYALNLKAANFPVLTARRRAHMTTDLEVLMLGDSHGWGQGSPGYDMKDRFYSSHMALPYSNGFYARLRAHIYRKYDFYREAVIPNFNLNSSPLQVASGKHSITKVEVTADAAAVGFYAPSGDSVAHAHLGYLARNNKFNENVLTLLPESEEAGDVLCFVNMKAHASKVYIGVLCGSDGAKMEIYFRGDDAAKRRSSGDYYPLAEGYPKVTKIRNGAHVPVTAEEAAVSDDKLVTIDTYSTHAEDVVYCVDFGQKMKGKLCLAYAGTNRAAVLDGKTDALLGGAALKIRGIIFDGNDVRNFSMGGHTVGQWIGDGTSSFNDPSHPHLDELLRFVPFTPSLCLIQAPVVNEYLRQTPLETFLSNLNIVTEKLNAHHNAGGEKKMDVLLFTTPGDKHIAFEGAETAAIGYGDYYAAVKQFASVGGYGFVDFEQYFRDNVANGLLDYEFLFDDPIHPGPYANEFIAKTLIEVIDLLM